MTICPLPGIFSRMRVLYYLGGILLFLPTQLMGGAASSHIHIQTEPPFFSPNQLTISSNTSLTWNNQTSEAHSILADNCRSRTVCSFDSGVILPAQQFVLSQLAPGHYPYHCGLHPFMRGLIIIHHQQFPSSNL